MTKPRKVLLFVTRLKMGDCEESEDDRTGAMHCDNNLKSRKHDIFPIVLPKMSTLWRTVRKWFAKNLKGRFKRCLSCQMWSSPQLFETGSPCTLDGSYLAGPPRHPCNFQMWQSLTCGQMDFLSLKKYTCDILGDNFKDYIEWYQLRLYTCH